MIEKLRQFMFFTRYIGLILANKAGLSRLVRNQLLRDYLVFKGLSKFPEFVTRKIKRLSFLGHPLSFFDLSTTIALIESIFIENEYFFKAKKRRPYILDLGSNIGLSVIYFKMLYPNCTVSAYEADQTTYEVLINNVYRFGFKKVEVYNLAVTDKNGYVDFYVDKQGYGSPLMSTSPMRISSNRKVKSKCIQLSRVISETVDFLKMDIEGSELQVLNNLNSSKKIKLIDQMSIEYHHHIDSKQDVLAKFLLVLEKNNFGYQIHAGQNTPFELKIFEDIQIHAYTKSGKFK